MSDLGDRIEAYLLAATGWVPSAELCRVFDVRERALRGLRGAPGLCSAFAISGDDGYRHVARATEKEFERFDARLHQHAVGELVRRMRLRRVRRALLARGSPARTRDGQQVLPGIHSTS